MTEFGYFKDKSKPSGIESTQRKQYDRLTAKKASIREITTGAYYKLEGWDPNYILSSLGRELSRVNIIAVLTQINHDENKEVQSINIDDATGSIMLRTFESQSIFSGLLPGNVIQIIGKPREFNQTRFIVPEIITKISKDWLVLRKLELEKEFGKGFENQLIDKTAYDANKIPKQKQDSENNIEEEIHEENDFDRIVKYIRKNDTGEGVDVENIIQSLNLNNAEQKIQELLKLGEVFEVRPGKIKIL